MHRAIAVLALLLLASGARGQEKNFLDLSSPEKSGKLDGTGNVENPPENEDEEAIEEIPISAVVVSSQRKPEALPLTVSLSFSKEKFRFTEPFVYEVVVTNSGDAPVVLPWSTRPGVLTESGRESGGVIGSLYIRFKDSLLGETIVGAVKMYGSEDVPSSLKTLRPGETATIRASSWWSIDNALRDPKKTGVFTRAFSTQVEFLVENWPVTDFYLPSRSERPTLIRFEPTPEAAEPQVEPR